MKRHLLIGILKALQISEFILGIFPFVFAIGNIIESMLGVSWLKLMFQDSYSVMYGLCLFTIVVLIELSLRSHLNIPLNEEYRELQ